MSIELKYDDKGLITAVVEDADSGDVLMVAYMNEESLRKTLDTNEMYYWSRSRQKLWHKGESSGHIQTVKEVRVDCDGDCLLFLVEQKGGACHEGFRTCFFRRLHTDMQVTIQGNRVFDPERVYGEK